MPNAKCQRCRVFVRNDLVERKIKTCRKSSKKFLEFKKKLGLDPDVVNTQYCIKNKRLDAYFSKYKLGIEVDEYNHEGRNSEYEQSRQFMIESHGVTRRCRF